MNNIKIPRIHPLERSFLDEAVTKVCFSPVTNSIAAVTAQGSLFSFTNGDLKSPARFGGHVFECLTADWSKDGLLLASAGNKGNVKIWDQNLSLQTEYQLGDMWVEKIAWNEAGQLAVSMGKKLYVLSISKQESFEISIDTSHSITGLGWQGNDHVIAVTYGKSLIINVSDQCVAKRFFYPEAMICLAQSPDRAYAAIGCLDRAARVWTTAIDDDALEMTGFDEKIQVLSWSHDSRLLVISGGPSMSVWKFDGSGPKGTRPIQLSYHEDVVSVAKFGTRSNKLVSCDRSGVIFFWSPEENGDRPDACALNRGSILTAEWNSNGSLFVSGDQDGSVALWKTV